MTTKRRKYTKEQLEKIFAQSKCYMDVKRALGRSPNGTNDTYIRYAAEYGLDTSHFTGSAWSRGQTKETHAVIARNSQKMIKHTPEKSLQNGIKLSSSTIRKLIKSIGIKEECEECGCLTEWVGKPLTLHIDHKNGNVYDNRIENIRYLCPNCHSQTPTFGSKNRNIYNQEIYICKNLDDSNSSTIHSR